MKGCGRNFQVSSNVIIKGLEYLKVGNDVYIAPSCQLILREGCSIGNEVLIGPNCVFADGNHGVNQGSYRFYKGASGSIHIGNGVWLAANCVVTHSSFIGDSALIGPLSVVRGKVPSGSKLIDGKLNPSVIPQPISELKQCDPVIVYKC